MNSIGKILLRRKNLVMAHPQNSSYEQTKTEKAIVIAALKNIQALGYTFSQPLLESLFHYSREELERFYCNLIPELKELVGADVTYSPMYPNFPTQVVEASDAELFINAIIHYWSFGTLMPEYEKPERLPLIDDNKMSILSIGSKVDALEIFKNLLSSKTSLSQQDKEDIRTFVLEIPDYYRYLPEEIPLKENVAYIGKLIIEEAPLANSEYITKYFNTATDVLRLITALSNGDVSLSSKTTYRNLKRKERRMIMDLLANCGNITEDLFRYQYEWIRVGEILHPFKYTYYKYKSVNQAFDVLRNKHKPLMLPGKIQNAILKKDMTLAAKLLKKRPGEFARQLDKLLRDSSNPAEITGLFSEVAEQVSTPVLLQVRQHFIGRTKEQNPVRVFFPKGNLARAMVVPNNLLAIPNTVCCEIVDICSKALISQYKEKDLLGKVFIDEDLSNYLVPFSQRSASKAVKTIVRGSQLPINDKSKAVRAFIWWTNSSKERIDIDLSASFYDENWNYKEHISYTHLRSSKFNACHSGDITNGGDVNGKGVAEFIDIDIDSAAKYGRYVVFQVHSFTNEKYSELPNCRFGWMEREDVYSGEIFEPSTVEMKMDLTAESTTAIPVIFDCVERIFIWCDMNLAVSSTRCGGNNLESNLKGVTATCYALSHLNKPNLYDLIYFNAFARGQIVTDRNDADIIFSNDKTIPYEVVEEINPINGLPHRVVKDKNDVPIITAYDIDYYVGKML